MFEDINLASSIGRQWNDFAGLKCDHFFVKIKEYQNDDFPFFPKPETYFIGFYVYFYIFGW